MNKPNQKDLNQMLTTSQVHFSMESYAKSLRCPDLIMKTIFKDGSELLETFEPAKREVFYCVKFEDNEQYSVFVDIKNKYNYSDQNLGKSSILKREKAFMKEKGLEYESISFDCGENMNTVNFNELFNKVKHELVRFEYRNRFLNSYTFKRDEKIFTLDFDKLLNIQIYSKVFNSEGVAVDLEYFYNSSYKLTTLQTKQVKKFIESLI